MFKHLRSLAIPTLALGIASAAYGQTDQQAKTRGGVGESLIDMERQWAEVCATHDTSVMTRILADDFLGTNTKGELYTKRQDIDKVATSPKGKYASGRLDKVKVRFFGENVAVLHGVEICMKKTRDRKEEPEVSTWTDTWLKRRGRWQIVAAQDAIY